MSVAILMFKEFTCDKKEKLLKGQCKILRTSAGDFLYSIMCQWQKIMFIIKEYLMYKLVSPIPSKLIFFPLTINNGV